MVFNSHAEKQDLVSHAEFLIQGRADAGLITASGGYPLKDFARNCNERLRMLWPVIFSAYNGWKFEDSNQTDLPQATQNLVSGTARYALPSDALTVERVIILDPNGNELKVEPLFQEEVDARMESIDSSTPTHYRLIGNTVELIPTPNYSATDGFKVYFDRDMVSKFVSTSTTETPGFASTFHYLIAVGAALDYAIANSMNEKAQSLSSIWERGVSDVREYYSKRFKDALPPRIKSAGSNYNWA